VMIELFVFFVQAFVLLVKITMGLAAEACTVWMDSAPPGQTQNAIQRPPPRVTSNRPSGAQKMRNKTVSVWRARVVCVYVCILT